MPVMVPCSEEDEVVASTNPTPRLVGIAGFLWFFLDNVSTKCKSEYKVEKKKA